MNLVNEENETFSSIISWFHRIWVENKKKQNKTKLKTCDDDMKKKKL